MLLLHILSVIGFITGILCLFAGVKLPPSKNTDMLQLLGMCLPLYAAAGAYKFNLENASNFYFLLTISMLLLLCIALIILGLIVIGVFGDKFPILSFYVFIFFSVLAIVCILLMLTPASYYPSFLLKYPIL